MASLMHMQKILSNRMQHFPTVEKAVANYAPSSPSFLSAPSVLCIIFVLSISHPT